MRMHLTVLAAAAVALGGTAAATSPASAATLTPLSYEASSTHQQAGLVEVRHGGWHRGHRWHRHRHRDRTAAAGIIGLGAGMLLGHALTAPRTGYYGYGHPPYRAYGGHPQYRVYGGPPPAHHQGHPERLDSRPPHAQP